MSTSSLHRTEWPVRNRLSGMGRIGSAYSFVPLVSLWFHDEGVSLGWFRCGGRGRIYFRWNELDRLWISKNRIGWGSGPIDSFVFVPLANDWKTVVDTFCLKLPDISILERHVIDQWDVSYNYQVYWPRTFIPPHDDAASSRFVRTAEALCRFSFFMPILFAVAWIGSLFFLYKLQSPMSAGTLETMFFGALLGSQGLMCISKIVIERILCHLTLCNNVVTRPFPVTLLINSIAAFGFIVSATLVFMS